MKLDKFQMPVSERHTLPKQARVALILIVLLCGFPSQAFAVKPNIILILADDLSAKELGCYEGKEIKTPALDELAQNGIMFKTAWASPVCGPSRALLLTGKYPCHTGYYNHSVGPGASREIFGKNLLIGQAMQKAGYATAMYGKLHDGGNPKDHGIDEYSYTHPWNGYNGTDQGCREIGGPLYDVQWYWHPGIVANGRGIQTGPEDFGPDLEVDLMRDFIRRHRSEPFFVYWPTFLPHMMYSPEKKWHFTDVPELDASGKKTGRKVLGSLKTNVEYLDHLVHKITAHLDVLGIRENTIIMFCADNGSPGYGKDRLESEVAIRVPFIVNAPGLVEKVGATDVLIDFTDILPTAMDLAGLKPSEGTTVDGRSFAPLLVGSQFEPREWIFCEYGLSRWVRDERWLLDGFGLFWDCGDSRDEWNGYTDVTLSEDPEVIAARKRFEEISRRYLLPNYDDPLLGGAWKAYLQLRRPVDIYRPDYLKDLR